MTRLAIPLSLVLAACLAACTSHPSATPESLAGTWEESAAQDHAPLQFQFAGTRNVIKSQKRSDGKWQQLGGGAFKFIDPKHLEVLLYPNSSGPVVYEVAWKDNDHMELRAGDETIQLARVKP